MLQSELGELAGLTGLAGGQLAAFVESCPMLPTLRLAWAACGPRQLLESALRTERGVCRPPWLDLALTGVGADQEADADVEQTLTAWVGETMLGFVRANRLDGRIRLCDACTARTRSLLARPDPVRLARLQEAVLGDMADAELESEEPAAAVRRQTWRQLEASLLRPFDAWLADTGMKVRPGAVAKGSLDLFTHTSLANGRYLVPWEQHDMFLRRMAWSVTRSPPLVNGASEVLGLVERHGSGFQDPFRMHLDVDLENFGPDGLTEEELWRVARAAQLGVAAGLRTEFAGRASLAVVLRAPRRTYVRKRKDGEPVTCTKDAMHVVFPFLAVDPPRAKELRHLALAEVAAALGPRNLDRQNAWEDAIDASPLETKGTLRMPFNDKFVDCPSCKGQDNTESRVCLMCAGSRKVQSGRPYTPAMVLDGVGDLEATRQLLRDIRFNPEQLPPACCVLCREPVDQGHSSEANTPDGAGDRLWSAIWLSRNATEEAMLRNVYYALRMTTIRCHPACPVGTFLRLDLAGSALATRRVEPRIARTSLWVDDAVRDQEKDSQLEARRAEDRAASRGESAILDQRAAAVDALMRKHVQRPEYRGLRVTKVSRHFARDPIQEAQELDNIVRCPAGSAIRLPLYLVRVLGPGSHFCIHNGGEHRGNNIAFLVCRAGIYQVCYSEKMRGAAAGCSERPPGSEHVRFLHPEQVASFGSEPPPEFATLFPDSRPRTVGLRPADSELGKRALDDPADDRRRQALLSIRNSASLLGKLKR